MEGYIKLWRSMLDWEHYLDINTKTLFLHLFLTANFKDVKYMGQIVPRGSRIIKENRIGDECGLTYQEVRTSLKKLISTGEVKKKTTNKFTLVSVANYEEYQSDTTTLNEPVTNNQRTINELSTSIEEERKNDKKERNITTTTDSVHENVFGEAMGYLMDKIISTPSGMAIQQMKDYSQTMTSEVIKSAIDKALDANKPNWNYINKILLNWQKAGIKTMADVERERQEWERRNGSNSDNDSRSSGKKTSGNPFFDMLEEERQ